MIFLSCPFVITMIMFPNYCKNKVELVGALLLNFIKVTVQFETEGNGQNEIFSRMDRSEVKL